ncbi:hypothetical protein EDC04DRAFT_2867920 [Pisolithus marmoratus]|nr:hypothetical protein EDC04DRAFT_2867920 [Pisolithus marmoratus]
MNKQRHWEDFMSGDWAWEEADKIISINSLTTRATLVPIILGSDKTTVSIATGQMDYYPLYLSIRNVCNTTHHVHCNAVVLIGFLAMPKIPETVLFGDQYYHHVIYSFAAYIADYEEQVLLSCIVHGWCPKCLAHQTDLDQDALWHCHEHTELIIKELDLQTLWDKYGIDRTIVPFTSEFPCVDIQRMLSPDILHQLIKGGFKDHLVDWVEKYLIHVHGRSTAEKILDDIDQRITAVTPFTGLQCLMKVCLSSFLNDALQLTQSLIGDALASFHSHHGIFHNAGVVLTFSLPQQHAMKHYPYLICQFGTPNGLCSSITESKHIKAVKQPYQHTNHFWALGQILRINERLDKFAAAQADFKKCQMLRGNCLSNESTASFEEDPGDTDDSPMSVKAHVSLAWTYHMPLFIITKHMHVRNMRDLAIKLNIPQFCNILWCFLQSQLQHDNHNPEDVPLDECPFYDGSVCTYNSVSLMFYAPSDMSGLHGMCCKHIHCFPTWRNEGHHYDCIFVITNAHMKGMLGLDVACVLCFFSFKHLGTEYPCAIICWFDCIGDGPNNTGMWVVCTHSAQDIAIIHIDTIYCAAQLIPVYASQCSIDPASIKPNESYDKFQFYYVNKFADHHVFEIAS